MLLASFNTAMESSDEDHGRMNAVTVSDVVSDACRSHTRLISSG